MDHDSAVWPADQEYLRPIMATAFLFVIPTMAVFACLRFPTTIDRFKSMSIVKILVLCTMVDSFIFVWASAILLFGVGTSFSGAACSVAIIWCIAFYASSKVFIYLFLMERVHLVHQYTVAGRLSRFKSPWYRASSVFFVLWLGVVVVMAIGRIAELRATDGACIIGLRIYATVPMLVVDAAVNIFLTTAFVIPIARSSFVKARRLARNSCIAAVAALITSFANIVVLSVQHGHQTSYVCLASCGIDVVVNSAIIFVITRGDRDGGDSSDITSIQHPSRDTKRRGSAYPVGVSSFAGGANSAIGINPFTPGAPLSGVSVISEVVHSEEKREEDAYVPLRQGWRGSQSGTMLSLPSGSPGIEELSQSAVHKLDFLELAEVDGPDLDDTKSADERV